MYNFNFSKVSLLFREITERNHVTPEKFKEGLFQEGDLAMIERFNLPFTEKNILQAISRGHLPVLKWAYEKGLKLTKKLINRAAKKVI